MNLLVDAGLDRLRVYRAGAVAPGLAGTGTDPITFLPPAALTTGPFPITRPAATLIRGCLHRPEGTYADLPT